MALGDEIIRLLKEHPGLSDREITTALRGQDAPHQSINQVARRLAAQGLIIRKRRDDSLIGNYVPETRQSMELGNDLLRLVEEQPGLTDREIRNTLRGLDAPQQPINQAARRLAKQGLLIRKPRHDSLIGNYASEDLRMKSEKPVREAPKNHDIDALSEDETKAALDKWLKSAGWTTTVAWGRARGIDIDARRGSQRWIIEVKGPGSRQPMRVNYFVGILGETLQRMSDTNARYSIAFPDIKQYRRLWERLPLLAKQRTKISLLLVSREGDINELND